MNHINTMRQALETLDKVGVMLTNGYNVLPGGEAHEDVLAAITALRQALANEALDKMAENARELGLDYEPVWNNLPSNKDVEDAMRLKRLSQLAEQLERPYRQLQDNGSKYFGESWDKAEQPSQCAPAADGVCESLDCPNHKPAQQEPVAFLANGTRFKISYDSRQSGGQIHGIPPELGGRWVAFVAADDDCHLKLTSPQPAQGCDHCNHSLYAGTKCKNCGRVTEQAAIKRGLTPEQPAQLPFGVGGGLVAIKTLLSRDPCVYAHTAIQMIDAILAEHRAQQEPVADEVRCPECGYLTKHTEHIGCLRKQLNAINAFEQRNFAIVNMDKFPPAQRTWVGLTDADKETPDMGKYVFLSDDWLDGYKTGLEKGEAKLKEKNT